MSMPFRRPALIAAALIAGSVSIAAAPAHAAPAGDDVRAMTVDYSDLNLSTIEGRRTLDRRIAHASGAVCAQSGPGLSVAGDVADCRAAARGRARAALVRVGITDY